MTIPPTPTALSPAQPAAEGATILSGVNVLIQGDGGVGKTHCLGTFVMWNPKIDCHYFAFESGFESLAGFFLDPPPRGLGMSSLPPNLHITTVKPPTASWNDLAENTKYINTMSYSALKKMGDPNRSKYDQFEKFLRTFNDVTSDDGRKWGALDKWGPNKAVFIDGLTGLGRSAMQAVVGGKIDRDQPDFGLAQGLIEEFLRRITDASCKCHFVLLTHIEREIDEVNGGSKITVSVPGKKLSGKIPPMFSDVILAKRVGKEFWWDTEDPNAVTKTRNLPIESKIKPDFKIILDSWQRRGGVVP